MTTQNSKIQSVKLLNEIIDNASILPLECQDLILTLTKGMVFTKNVIAMKETGVHGHVDIVYYEDAALVKLNGEYYNMFSYETGLMAMWEIMIKIRGENRMEKKVDITPKRTALAQTMTNGELYRYAWTAVRIAIENTEKWVSPDAEEIERLKKQEKELKELMNESFLDGV